MTDKKDNQRDEIIEKDIVMKEREAEFIMPANTLKAKVGSGGLTDDILSKAENLLQDKASDFPPLAGLYLNKLESNIEKAQRKPDDFVPIAENISAAAMQLKANGGMFNYNLVSDIADRLMVFLENTDQIDDDMLEIMMAFYTTMKAVISSKITGTGGQHGKELLLALDSACTRYYKRYREND